MIGAVGIEVRRMTAAERDRVLAMVVTSFRDDPEVRHWFRTDEEYDTHAAGFFGALLDARLAGGEVWVADDGDAVAMWDPPGGVLTDPGGPAANPGTLPREISRRIAATDALVEAQKPREPHWYLGVLASSPARRGEGLAHAVLRPVLASADRTATPVTLETATDANLRYYTRLGFARTAAIALPGGGPDVHVMRREARPVSRG